MRHKWRTVIVVAALATAAAMVGIAASRAHGSPTLQDMSVAQLLAKVAAGSQTQTAISGDVAWSNGLVPGSGLSSLLTGQSSAPGSVSDLALGGSGRLWLKRDSGLRLAVQGSEGDFVLIAGKQGVWTYSSTSDTATHYSLAAKRSASASASDLSPQEVPADLPATLASALERFATIGKVTFGPQTSVAGQPCYLLVLSPASTLTSVGSLRVAVDAKTFVPLRFQVYAKGDGSAVLSAGFTSISYGHLDASLFDFVPPAGATVSEQALPAAEDFLGGSATDRSVSEEPVASEAANGKSLTLAQAETSATRYGLALVVPKASPSALPFAGATVTATHEPVAILRYGSGFGSIVLIESKGADGSLAGLGQQLGRLPRALLGSAAVAGQAAWELRTPLINLTVWRRGATEVVAAGAVSQTSLDQLLAAVR